MENIEWIISLATTTLGLIVTVATLIAKFAKNVKAKTAAEQTVELCNAMIPFIEQAEKFANYTGEEKKQYVMTRANRYAIDNAIGFDEHAVSDKIDELVALTKQVNRRDTESSAKSDTRIYIGKVDTKVI